MAKRRYQPGLRNKTYIDGRLRDHVKAFLEVYIGKFSMEVYPEVREGEEYDQVKVESGDDVRLCIAQTNGRTVRYNLSALTHEELVQMRQLFNMLFDAAEPIVLMRDMEAKRAYENGDDSFARLYRALPKLVVRPGPLTSHSEGIHGGPSSDAQGPVD